jgi:energy-coupling factor transporter ATP-binding protein EcfA2
MIEKCEFPWGIYLGDLKDEEKSILIPFFSDSSSGGLTILSEEGEDNFKVLYDFIENISFSLLDTIEAGCLKIEIYDTSKRFPHLSKLDVLKLYDIYYSSQSAKEGFDRLEELIQDRHHNLLTDETPTVSKFNSQYKSREAFHLVLFNLDFFPNENISVRRLKYIFENSYGAGVFVLAYGSTVLEENNNDTTKFFLDRFTQIRIKNRRVDVSNIEENIDIFDFKCLNMNKDIILEKIESDIKSNIGAEDKNFLEVAVAQPLNRRETINFALGEKEQAYHAFIGGKTGSGKTTLLNNLIIGIAEKYTPDEIRLYLMDYKEGVEFQRFENHPNCEKIFLDNSDLEAASTLLESFNKEIEKRGKLFKECGVGNIDAYNDKNPENPIFRIILIIDEVQKLFSGDFRDRHRFEKLLDDVLRRGRSFGIHLIMSTQGLAGAEIDKNLLNQIGLRITFNLSNDKDCIAILSSDNYEARNLGKYEIIINNNAGNKDSNIRCIALPPKEIEIIDEILKTRKPDQILRPEFVSSSVEANHEKAESDNEKRTDSQQNKMSREEKIAYLLQEGKRRRA